MSTVELAVRDVADEQLHRYRFQAKNWGGISGRLFINEVEIHSFSPQKSQVSCDDIQNWLMPGDNNVVISITAGPQAEHDAKTQSHPYYECSLHGMAQAGFPNYENCLWEITIDELSQAPPLTLHYVFGFTSLQVPTSQLWRKAEVVNVLQPDDKAALLALQDSLVGAFERGEVDKVMEIYRFVVSEQALMRDEDISQSMAQVREEVSYFAELAQQGLIRFEQEKEVYFNQLVGNRVVQLRSETGTPTVTLSAEHGDFIHLNMYAAKIDGQWILVRR